MCTRSRLAQWSATLSVLVAALSAARADTPSDSVRRFTGETMSTYFVVTVRAEQLERYEPESDALQAGVQSVLDTVENQMSNWRDSSDVSRFNRTQSTDWFEVSPATAQVVAEALRVARISGGAFDPTVSPLIRLWSFGEDDVPQALPGAESIQTAREHTGWQKLQVRVSPPAIRKLDPHLEINLSAIAKGYAVDAVAEWLTERGFSDFLVDVGGENRAAGRKSEGSCWTIGIQNPEVEPASPLRALELENRSIATSGDYRNFFVHEGKRYSHTIDPTTGYPVDHELASVSVLAETCMAADALATAITVLGPDAGLRFAEQHNLSVLLLERHGDGFREHARGVFAAVVRGRAESPTQNGPSAPSLLQTVLAALAVIAIAVTGMAIGVIVSNRRLKGTCGGLSSMTGEGHSPCELCTTPADECPNYDGAAKADGVPAEETVTRQSPIDV